MAHTTTSTASFGRAVVAIEKRVAKIVRDRVVRNAATNLAVQYLNAHDWAPNDETLRLFVATAKALYPSMRNRGGGK